MLLKYQTLCRLDPSGKYQTFCQLNTPQISRNNRTILLEQSSKWRYKAPLLPINPKHSYQMKQLIFTINSYPNVGDSMWYKLNCTIVNGLANGVAADDSNFSCSEWGRHINAYISSLWPLEMKSILICLPDSTWRCRHRTFQGQFSRNKKVVFKRKKKDICAIATENIVLLVD